MTTLERLAGAIITGLALATAMAQAVAFSGPPTGGSEDLRSDETRSTAMEGLLAVGFPEPQAVEYVVAHPEARVEILAEH